MAGVVALLLGACGPKYTIKMPRPVASTGEWTGIEQQARAAFEKAHPEFKVMSLSFTPAAWKESEDKSIGATYRAVEAWIAARSDKGCSAFRSAFRAQQAPDKTWTPVDWYADRDMGTVDCDQPYAEDSPGQK